ncbi:PorT family protein [Mucilaginibacter daejeonensis]|uniref:porin family protein n=1 Tax=Mucilaginibacter daejeonensis TaxID=398049 RepID=UPI001D1707B7|nr:porin family protein [Mucilaginibacter daejeonensis]UEG53714.1 PorT family protein [Mucilaginibacter daejeonensis]
MKKYILSIALLVITIAGAKAQASLGIKGGINLSKINRDDLTESTVTGYQVGLYGRIGNNLYLQPELYLGSRGGKFETNVAGGTSATATSKVTFTTLNVPLLVGTKIVNAGTINVRAMLGPVYSYNLDKNTSAANNASGAINDFGDYKNSTLGFQAGAGVDIGSINVDLRYEGGLTKINEKYGQRANLWALSVGFKIL